MKKIDELIERIAKKGNPTCLGLDTQASHIPPELNGGDCAEAILRYNKALIDGLADLIPAVKLQIAFYEMLGINGLTAFRATMDYARAAGLTVIADAKRNDIASTAEAYAKAYFSADAPFPADFLTINGYLGTDGIMPFADAAREGGQGMFILVKTSNPSSSDLQDMKLADGRLIYQAMADLVGGWGQNEKGENNYSGVGAVVGATYPQQLTEIRERLPHTFFLVPGYGAQGAGGKELRGGFDAKGSGAIVNASRSLLCAWQKAPSENWLDAARAETIRMRQDIIKEF